MMKRLILILLSLTLLCACQPTPEVDAVKQKDTNVLIDTVLSEQTQTEADNPPAPVSAQFPCGFSATKRPIRAAYISLRTCRSRC